MMGTYNKTILRRVASIAAFVGILAFTSACGSTNVGNGPVVEAPSTSPTVVETAPATETPTPSATGNFFVGTPAPTGERVTAPHGDYLQSIMPSNDPAMSLVSTTLHESVASMDQLELILAQQTIITFIAEQGIDSPLNGGVMTVDEWWVKNKDKINPTYQGKVYQNLKEGDPFVMNEKWQQEKKYGGKYQYATSPDKPRIYDRIITPKFVWKVEGTEVIAVEADVSYTMPVVPGIGETKSGIQTTSGTMSYSVVKDPATGKWLIDGYHHEMQTIEG